MNLRPAQPIRHRPNRAQQQRTPSSRRDQGAAPERSKPWPSNLLRLRSRRSQPSTTTRRRHIVKPTLHLPKSIKACSRSASRVGIAIKRTSSSWHHNRAWFAREARPTICGSPSPARWDARSATSSPSPGQPSLWRRAGLVEQAGYRSRRDGTAALGFDPAHRIRTEKIDSRTKLWMEPRNLFQSPVASTLRFRRIAMPTIQRPQLDHASPSMSASSPRCRRRR